MPVTTNHSAGDFPLANSSRRRRRLAALARVVESGLPVRRRAAECPRTEPLSIWASSTSGDLLIEGHSPHAALQAFLTCSRPVAWMVAGDDYSQVRADTAGFCQTFAGELRPLRRPQSDPIINVAAPGGRLAEVRRHLETWLRHAPDVLLLLSGPADASAGVDHLRPFEENVESIVAACRDAGVLPILTTSPLPLVSETDADYVAPLVYAEALRALSAEWDVPLVDFRDEWEQLAIRPGLAGSWIDEDAATPSTIGLMHLVDQLMREFDRHRAPARQPQHTAANQPVLGGSAQDL